MERPVPRPVLRPLRVAVEAPRYAWSDRPAYRTRVVHAAIERRPTQKKRPAGY